VSTRGPYAKGEAKRKEILDAALEAVAVNGSRGTRVREIAERVGLSQAGLMHYFRTREELFQAVLGARDDHDTDEFVDTQASIEGFFAVMAYNLTVPGLVQLYVEYSAEAAHPGHPSHEFFQQRYRDFRGLLMRAVDYARSTGEMGEELDPAALVDVLIASADGLQVQWLLDNDIDVVGRLRALWNEACIASHHSRDSLTQV
jgi:AcrR family transcriptional regulator